jgi:lipopolysaccharide transport system permease protein
MAHTASRTLPQTIIRPQPGWRLIDWRELREYRDLFYFLVWRDIKVLYKQTVLGFAWAIIRPVFSMVVFSVVFGGLARVPSDGVPYPVFSYAALLPWTYFATTTMNSSNSLVGNAPMLTKIYFPRLMIPMTPVLAGLVDFAVAALILCALMIGYGIVPSANVVFLPLLLVILVLTATGGALWLSALTIQYRDVKHAMQFSMQLLMYAAPVVWPASLLNAYVAHWGHWIRWVYGLYPMAGVIEGFRAALLGTRPMPWDLILMGGLSATLLAVTGALYFRKTERIFADVA